ncbi:MAG: hypothetical protein ACREMY_12205, partial [bacterium]
GLGESIMAWIIGCGVMIIASAFNKMGMGDAKLMGAIGAFLGWVDLLLVIGYFFLLWGLVAVVRFALVLPWKSMIGKLMAVQAGGKLLTDEEAERVNKTMKSPIPLAPWIAAAVLITELFATPTLQFLGFGPSP